VIQLSRFRFQTRPRFFHLPPLCVDQPPGFRTHGYNRG